MILTLIVQFATLIFRLISLGLPNYSSLPLPSNFLAFLSEVMVKVGVISLLPVIRIFVLYFFMFIVPMWVFVMGYNLAIKGAQFIPFLGPLREFKLNRQLATAYGLKGKANRINR